MSNIGGDYRCPSKMEIVVNIVFWIFDAQFGYPIFEGIFTLNT
jgi:hypothetical protein